MIWSPPVAIQDHKERVVLFGDGEARRDVNVTLTEEQYRRMAQGYQCVRCYALQDTAFPDNCGFPGCDGYRDGFPMAERQREVMEQEFDGEEWVGPSSAMHEASEIWTPQKGE